MNLKALLRGQKVQQVVEDRQVELEKIFDSQLKTLKERGVSQDVLAIFSEKRPMVIEKAMSTHMLEERISFLPVIPRQFLTIYSQMPMVRYTNKKGEKRKGHVSFNVNPNGIHNDVDAEVPKVPYFIFEVEDSVVKTLGKSPQEADICFKNQIRSGLTDCEVISLCIHTDVLSTHGVYAVNSHYGTNGHEVKVLQLNCFEAPELALRIFSLSHKQLGSASCRFRF